MLVLLHVSTKQLKPKTLLGAVSKKQGTISISDTPKNSSICVKPKNRRQMNAPNIQYQNLSHYTTPPLHFPVDHKDQKHPFFSFFPPSFFAEVSHYEFETEVSSQVGLVSKVLPPTPWWVHFVPLCSQPFLNCLSNIQTHIFSAGIADSVPKTTAVTHGNLTTTQTHTRRKEKVSIIFLFRRNEKKTLNAQTVSLLLLLPSFVLPA